MTLHEIPSFCTFPHTTIACQYSPFASNISISYSDTFPTCYQRRQHDHFFIIFHGTEYRLWAVFFHHGNSMRKYGYLISYLLHGRLNPNQRTNHSPIPQCKVGWLSVMHIFQTWTVFQKSNEILTRPPLTSTNLHRYNSICVYTCIAPSIYMSVPSTILTNTSRKRICILISILLRMLKRNNKIPFLRVKSLVISQLPLKRIVLIAKSCQMIKKCYKPLE